MLYPFQFVQKEEQETAGEEMAEKSSYIVTLNFKLQFFTLNEGLISYPDNHREVIWLIGSWCAGPACSVPLSYKFES